MGGFAALAFSSLLNATDVIAFCPQIELKKWPYFDAFANKYNLPDMFRVEDGLSQSAQLYCFYGYGHEHDRNVLERDLTTMSAKNSKRLHLYPIDYNEHTVMVPLQKSGCLGAITQSVIDNNDAPARIEKLLVEKGDLVRKQKIRIN